MFVQAKELVVGQLVDLQPVIDQLFEAGKITEDQYNDAIMSVEYAYSDVDGIEFEYGEDGYCVVISSVNGGNWCVGAEVLVEVVGWVEAVG